MHGRVPRLVRAVKGSLIDAPMSMVMAGWVPIIRSCDPSLREIISLEFADRVPWGVRVSGSQLEAARTYIVGQWLSDSGGTGHNLSWARWLCNAFMDENPLNTYAVLYTVHRWIHRCRRQTRGMRLSSPLYDAFPSFLRLYSEDLEHCIANGTLLENLRALLQLRDIHTCERSALVYTAEWIEGLDDTNDIVARADQVIQEALARSVWSSAVLLKSEEDTFSLYKLVLTAPSDVARCLFEGIKLTGPRCRPQRIRGNWTGDLSCNACTALVNTIPLDDIMFRFLYLMEFNSYVSYETRYQRPPPKAPCLHQSKNNCREIWVVRKTYSYS